MVHTAKKHSITDEEAVVALINRALEISQSDNFDPYFDLFSDDARWMMPSRSEDVYLEEAKSFYRFTRKFRFDQRSRIDEVLISGDIAFARISLDGYLRPKNESDATPLRSSSRHIWVMQRQSDGSWKITCDIWNNPKTK